MLQGLGHLLSVTPKGFAVSVNIVEWDENSIIVYHNAFNHYNENNMMIWKRLKNTVEWENRHV